MCFFPLFHFSFFIFSFLSWNGLELNFIKRILYHIIYLLIFLRDNILHLIFLINFFLLSFFRFYFSFSFSFVETRWNRIFSNEANNNSLISSFVLILLVIFSIGYIFPYFLLFTFYPSIKTNIYINIKVTFQTAMFQWYRWNTFRLLERNERESGRIFGFFRSQRRIGIIEIEEKFYAILSLATSSSSCALFRSRKRGGGGAFIFTNHVEWKPALKRILSSPSRGED